MPTVKQSRSLFPGHALDVRWLLALPALTYSLSYVYLAVYHGRSNIWNVTIHEGGLYTFWETIFYASHFLGHVPVYTMVALLFVGAYRSLTPDANASPWKERRALLGAAVLLLLGASLIFSLMHFGREDTVSYILQRKQTTQLYIRGGSWNLHLASSTLLFLWVPVYVFVVCLMWGKKVIWSTAGLGYFVAALLLLVGFTSLANGRGPAAAFAVAWSDPRYLAHSVRELVTFSLIYFPIPLFFLLRSGPALEPRPHWPRDRTVLAIAGLLGGIFIAALIYQCVASLAAGIGDMAQKPAFAHDGSLSVFYLLSSHFFEHVLDSVYFILLVSWLFTFKRRRHHIDHVHE